MRRVFRLSRPAWGGIVLLLVATGTLLGVTGHLVSGQDGLALARLLPKGALAYVQARDLGKLLAQWRASSVHDRYYASDSFRAFRRSRLWAKLNERIREFEEGVGVTLTEDTVMQMAGKATAIALYDMGKLELVFVTELSAQQAAATPLLARKATFEARTTAAGQPYLVRELATDGGRLRQGLCVATPPGKLVVATSEALMQRTLDNLDGKGDDHVLASMGPTLAAAQGFTPHDVTLWTDLPRLRQQPYFGYYWVHGAKAPGLDEVEATLADLELTSEGLVERRWSLTSGRAVPAAFTPQQQPVVARLLNASPFAVVETLPVDAGNVPAQIAVGILFPLPRPVAASDLPRIRVIEDTASSTARRGRYERLDERFDRDVDDPDALSSRPPARQAAGTRPPDPLESELTSLFRSAQPACLAWLGETTAEGSAPFVTFERALALHCRRPFDTKAYEAALARAIARRYFVAGTTPPVTWEVTSTGVVVPRTAVPLERCGAYFVSGDLVVMASSADYARRLKARLDGTAGGAAVRPASNLTGTYRQATVRLRALAPDYQRALRLIDAPGASGLEPLEGEADDASVPFMGQNIPSLLTVVEAFDVVTMESAAAGRVRMERVSYAFRPAATAGG
ncbi:hypothetical protein J8C01_09040 [Chloracidobacterium sp. D]|jgi:hypothetical protein|uniref:hypothetical protein n=1 Tax=Chloracidobacterium sp. D TaxID=2821536 RepID=UPI001B8B6EEF|nr:hypothetical protein [Chloracidobacterium sp. D]QUV81365.1 hypothetical protein J8C01_09040 [Chloracidobacterium sp. D]